MKITILTAVYNNAAMIESCIKSVMAQTYKDIEYIVIDGGSKDGTVDIINRNADGISKWSSEPDRGIYDALNKGIGMATGDVVGLLHSDDMFADDTVIESVASALNESGADSCYGDLCYVDRADTDKIIRYWKSKPYRPGMFKMGWMPPHPTFYAKRELYERLGGFNIDFKIAADYELMLRYFEKHKISSAYIPRVLVKMRWGGKSNKSLRNLIIKTSEDYRAWKINGLERRIYTIPFKNLSKIKQFFAR